MRGDTLKRTLGVIAFALAFAGLVTVIERGVSATGLGLVMASMLIFSGLWVRSLREVPAKARPGFVPSLMADERKLRQRFRLERLEGVSGHSDEWMKGFAKAAEFLIRNYLSPRQTSMTEEAWWESYEAASGGTEPFGPETAETMKKSYVDYMLYSLFDGAGVTADEYARIASMIEDDDVRETLGMTFYSDRLRTSGTDAFGSAEGASV